MKFLFQIPLLLLLMTCGQQEPAATKAVVDAEAPVASTTPIVPEPAQAPNPEVETPVPPTPQEDETVEAKPTPSTNKATLPQEKESSPAATQVVAPPPPPSPPSAPAPAPASTTNEAPTPPPVREAPAMAPRPDHQAWTALLGNFVSPSGRVNYSGLKAQEGKLDAYIAELAQAIPNSDWTRNEGMAYWMNAYNAFTVKLILQNWPVSSITDLHNGKPWDVKWIKLAGKTYSLNQIEHQILRPTYKDARIHFAVNCAAQSCPPLHNAAFTAANLNGTLNRLTNRFINNEKYNSISAEAASVSKIFDWYKEDFGDLSNYLNKYADTKMGADAPISYQDYDWALNGG